MEKIGNYQLKVGMAGAVYALTNGKFLIKVNGLIRGRLMTAMERLMLTVLLKR